MIAEHINDRYYSYQVLRWPFWLDVKYRLRSIRILSLWELLLYIPLVLVYVTWNLFVRILLLDGLCRLLTFNPSEKWKPEVEHGVKFPRNLTRISMEEIPKHVKSELDERLQEAQGCGLRLCHPYRLETIGNLEAFHLLCLDATGQIILTIRWSSRIKKRDKQTIWLFFSTITDRGTIHISSTNSAYYLNPELRLASEQYYYDAQASSIEMLLLMHRKNLPDSTKLRRFNCESLEEYAHELEKLRVETLLDRKIFFELTAQEIQKLRSL